MDNIKIDLWGVSNETPWQREQRLKAQEAGKRASEAAIAHCNPEWGVEAKQALKRVCQKHRVFTTDSVHEELDKIAVTTRSPAAFGGLIRNYIGKWFIDTNEPRVASCRIEAHGRRIPIYQSLIYGTTD